MASTTKARMFGSIAKVEELEDGTVMVEGIASSPTPDSDGEVFTPDCMKDAIPDYMEKRRALREMHQPIAAGVTKAMWVDADGYTRIQAHVVDPVSVKKVQTGVLKMFSIEGVVPAGGRDAVNRKVINKLKLREVSLVDVGANPDAMIEVVKLDTEKEGTMPEETKPAAAETQETPAAPAAEPENPPAPAAEPAAEPAPEAPAAEDTAKAQGQGDGTQDTVRKGLYSVQDFAGVIRQIGYICSDAEGEAQMEGDNSPLPGKLRDWLAQGAGILNEMTQEETAELLASLGSAAAKVQKPGEGEDGVEKKGAKYSKATKAALANMRAKMDEMAECMKAFEDAKDDDGDDDAKKLEAGAASEDAVAKAAALEDRVTKLQGELTTVQEEKAALQQELDKAEKGLKDVVDQMKAKGMLRLVGKDGDDPKAVKKSESGDEAEPTDPLEAIRKVQRSGGVFLNHSAR